MSQEQTISSAETPESTEDEARLWANFADADNRESFSQSWLALQCRMLPGVVSGMVLFGEPDTGPLQPIAHWPAPEGDFSKLRPAADRALMARQGLLERGDAGDDEEVRIAYPIEAFDKVMGVVVLGLMSRPKAELQDAFRKLHWGIAWIELFIRRSAAGAMVPAQPGRSPEQARLENIVELLACVVEEPRFRAAAMAFVTELATVLGCDRASLGLLKGKRLKVQAISHSADFGKHMNLVRAIEGAMEEALDQQSVIRVPGTAEGIPLVTQVHQALIDEHGGLVLCSVPFGAEGELVGVVTLERYRGKPFDDGDIRLAEGVAELAGPVLITKRRDDRWLVQKAVDSARDQLGRLFGRRHLGYKLVALSLTGLIAFLSLAEGQYRVSADAVLEGAIQRVIAVPQQGYVVAADVRAGDLVEAGQVMARLDDRDLELERLKLSSQREQYLKEYREAQAAAERAQVRILDAQISQTEAQLALTLDQLSRLKLLAPFDGIVVSGDLSQSLGAPVERGEQLFVVAPLDRYRVVIKVDERQIADVLVGQKGLLALTGMPSDKLELVVDKITPVATAEEGRNYFRIEASLLGAPEALRPGMQGVAKVDIDRRKLIWIWTRELMNWLRLTLWAWWR